MANAELISRLTEGVAPSFRPYAIINRESDSLTFYFRPDADKSERLTDHVTVFLSIDTGEIVGCRLKGIASLLEDLPNYVQIDREGQRLLLIILSFRGGAPNDTARDFINRLAKAAKDSPVTLEEPSSTA